MDKSRRYSFSFEGAGLGYGPGPSLVLVSGNDTPGADSKKSTAEVAEVGESQKVSFVPETLATKTNTNGSLCEDDPPASKDPPPPVSGLSSQTGTERIAEQLGAAEKLEPRVIQLVRPAPPPPPPSSVHSDSNDSIGFGATRHLPSINPEERPTPPPETDIWMDVAHTRGTSCFVNHCFNTNEYLSEKEPDMPLDTDPELIVKKIDLQPASVYKFRVAAINGCGRGPWGEVVAFKTFEPQFPGAPSSIRITNSIDGVSISWEASRCSLGEIMEYSAYLVVKPPASTSENSSEGANKSFLLVYRGANSYCNVPNYTLNHAYVDTASKPAIIFRIAARNFMGYGPATQVRWLQDTTSKADAQKRSATATPANKTTAKKQRKVSEQTK